MWKPQRKDIKIIWENKHSPAAQNTQMIPCVIPTAGDQQLVSKPLSDSTLLTYLLLLCMQLVFTVLRLRSRGETLERENAWLREQNKRLTYEKFVGKGQQIEGQLIFPEVAEMEITPPAPSQDDSDETSTVQVKGHKRKKRGLSLTTLVKDFMEEEVRDIYPEECTCPECNRKMTDLGIGKERLTISVIPARLKLIREKAHTVCCSYCKMASVEPLPIITAALPPAFMPGSFATPELVAHIASEKFLMCDPLYRLEKYFKIKGFSLSRQTMDNWLFEGADMLEPLWERLGYYFKQSSVGHADESPLLCLHTKERNGHKKKGYMWIYRSGRLEEHQVIFYKFFPGRKQEYYKEFIADYTGYLITDGLQVYHDNEELEAEISGCWQHARAKFVDAAKFGRDDAANPTSPAMQALSSFKKFFAIESKIRDLPAEQRLAERIKHAKPVTDALKAWLDKMKPSALPKSLLGMAINYSLNQWKYMETIYKDGRLDATNSLAERCAKAYVLSRKNFLFVNVEKGGKVVGIFCSLIASAYANKLDPEKYLTWVLRHIKSVDASDPAALDVFLPWNAPDECKIPGALKKPKDEAKSKSTSEGQKAENPLTAKVDSEDAS